MKKVNMYIVASIFIFTLAVVVYLIFKANEIQKYAMIPSINIPTQKTPDEFIHNITRILSSIFGR